MKRVFQLYNSLLTKYPFATQSLTMGTLMTAGDTIAQRMIERRDQNYRRTVQFALLGTCFTGPVLRTWYLLLERLVGSKGSLSPMVKLALDQLAFTPLFQLVNIPIIESMKGKSMEQMKVRIKRDYFDIMKANYKLWPIAQVVNFYVIPINYRVPWVAIVGLFWNTYFAWKLGEKQIIV